MRLGERGRPCVAHTSSATLAFALLLAYPSVVLAQARGAEAPTPSAATSSDEAPAPTTAAPDVAPMAITPVPEAAPPTPTQVLPAQPLPAVTGARPEPAPATDAMSLEASDSLPREGHAVYGGGGPMLLGVGLGAGVVFGAYLGRDVALEADGYLGVSSSVFGASSSTKTVSLAARLFFGETFVVRGGVRLRHMEIEESPFLDLFGTDMFDEIRVQTDIGFDVAVGHRFQIEHFAVGVDWLGVYAPVAEFDSEKQIVDPTNDEILAREPSDLRGVTDVRVLFIQFLVSG